MEELKPCPFCGGGWEIDGNRRDDKLKHKPLGRGCPLAFVSADIYEAERWNTRPIEDKLRQEYDTLRRDNLRLSSNVAELRTERAQLKERCDTFDAIDLYRGIG